MGVREAAYAVGLLLPEYVIPVHHGTFPNQEVDMGKLVSGMAVRAPKSRLVSIAPGETFTYEG